MSAPPPFATPAATPPDSIAFVCGDSRQLSSLSRLLRRAVGSVAVADSLQGIRDYSSFALVAVHYDALTAAEQAELAADFSSRAGRPTLLLLSEQCAQRDFARLFGSRALTNMLVVNEDTVDVSDLLVTVQKSATASSSASRSTSSGGWSPARSPCAGRPTSPPRSTWSPSTPPASAWSRGSAR